MELEGTYPTPCQCRQSPTDILLPRAWLKPLIMENCLGTAELNSLMLKLPLQTVRKVLFYQTKDPINSASCEWVPQSNYEMQEGVSSFVINLPPTINLTGWPLVLVLWEKHVGHACAPYIIKFPLSVQYMQSWNMFAPRCITLHLFDIEPHLSFNFPFIQSRKVFLEPITICSSFYQPEVPKSFSLFVYSKKVKQFLLYLKLHVTSSLQIYN